jgi:hypothetical protein
LKNSITTYRDNPFSQQRTQRPKKRQLWLTQHQERRRNQHQNFVLSHVNPEQLFANFVKRRIQCDNQRQPAERKANNGTHMSRPPHPSVHFRDSERVQSRRQN